MLRSNYTQKQNSSLHITYLKASHYFLRGSISIYDSFSKLPDRKY